MNTIAIAKNIRIKCLKMVHTGKASHIGSALSIADILAVLYGEIINININNYNDENRDRFILSKGHSGVAIYAALSEVGLIPEKELESYYHNQSLLSGHVSHKGNKGIELSTGSLGHGIGVASGFALAAKLDKKNYHSYCVIGDGECDEGSIWEAALFAAHHKLSNLTVIVDHNKMQSMNSTENTIDLLSLVEKWKSFGWDVFDIDGHNHKAIYEALKKKTNKPKCIIANTIKGKGVSYMEGKIEWHYKFPDEKQLDQAIKEVMEK